jgi:integrase/recombinase XerC
MQRLSVNTINSYLTAIRRFFGYLEINGVYENITKDIKSIKISKIPKKQVLTLEQTKEIYSKLTDARQKCLFSLAITTGLRGIEMANARIEDIQIYNGEIVLWVKCKGHDDKDEYVKLSPQVLNDIYAYIGSRTSGNIFVSNSNRNKNGGVTTKTLRLEIKTIFRQFGLDVDSLSLHSTRRTSATIAYNNGADIKEIQQMLHHMSLQTTSRYISQSTRDNAKTEYDISDLILGG